MATEIFINTDLKDLTANVVANKNRPTQLVRLPQIVEGETLDIELSLVNSSGSYDSRSGDATVDLAVAVSAKGAAATSGTFTLTAGTQTTAPIAYNASGQAVQDALNALNSNTGAYGSTVVVSKLAAGSYRVIFDTVGERTVFGGKSIDLAPESEVVAATSVVGSSTIRAQQVIEISQQPAIYTSTWTAGTNKFTGQLNAKTARVQEFIAAGLEAHFEVKANDAIISQVPVTLLPAVAAPNSLPAHVLPSNLNEFAADPSTNGSFSVTNWLADLLAPHTKAVWGYITGTLSDQTDLQSALDAKASASDVSTNTSNIASNASSITTNTSNIAINTTDIATNASNISTNTANIATNTTNIATKAPSANPSFTGSVTTPRVVTSEIQCEGNSTATAQPINYDANEHRFRDFDANPSDLLIIEKIDGYTGARVGINKDPSASNAAALHIVAGKNSSTNVKDLGLKVTGGGGFFEKFVRVGHYTNATRVDSPNNGNLIYNTDASKFQGYQAGSGWSSFVTNEPDDTTPVNSIRQVTQNTYDNLTPDANTVYIIVG